MAGFNSVLGIMAGGGGRGIPQLPVDPTPDQLKSVLAEVIAKLNNFSRDTVISDNVTVTLTGAAVETTAVAHNLGYKPRAIAYLDNRDLQTDLSGGIAASANLQLPTGLRYTVGSGVVAIVAWLEFFVDVNNIYFRCLNGNASTGAFNVKYFLSRDPAN